VSVPQQQPQQAGRANTHREREDMPIEETGITEQPRLSKKMSFMVDKHGMNHTARPVLTHAATLPEMRDEISDLTHAAGQPSQRHAISSNVLVPAIVVPSTDEESETSRHQRSVIMNDEGSSSVILQLTSRERIMAASTHTPVLVTMSPQHEEFETDPWDVEDRENIQCVTKYSRDIFSYLKTKETEFAAKYGYMQQTQAEINEKMRAILVDWIVDVHVKFKLLPETLFLAVNIIDRFLENVPIQRQKLQLVGITSLFIAAKYEEIYPPELKDFVYVTDKAYTKADVLEMEGKIISTLQFNLATTSPFRFLERYARIAKLDTKFYYFARFLLELSLIDYKMLRYPPSQLGVATVFLANKLCGHNEINETILSHAGYRDSVVKPCVHEMILLLQANEKSTLQAIRRKFSHPKYCEVSKIRINVVEKRP
jgi:cyclin B